MFRQEDVYGKVSPTMGMGIDLIESVFTKYFTIWRWYLSTIDYDNWLLTKGGLLTMDAIIIWLVRCLANRGQVAAENDLQWWICPPRSTMRGSSLFDWGRWWATDANSSQIWTARMQRQFEGYIISSPRKSWWSKISRKACRWCPTRRCLSTTPPRGMSWRKQLRNDRRLAYCCIEMMKQSLLIDFQGHLVNISIKNRVKKRQREIITWLSHWTSGLAEDCFTGNLALNFELALRLVSPASGTGCMKFILSICTFKLRLRWTTFCRSFCILLIF